MKQIWQYKPNQIVYSVRYYRPRRRYYGGRRYTPLAIIGITILVLAVLSAIL